MYLNLSAVPYKPAVKCLSIVKCILLNMPGSPVLLRNCIYENLIIKCKPSIRRIVSYHSKYMYIIYKHMRLTTGFYSILSSKRVNWLTRYALIRISLIWLWFSNGILRDCCVWDKKTGKHVHVCVSITTLILYTTSSGLAPYKYIYICLYSVHEI